MLSLIGVSDGGGHEVTTVLNILFIDRRHAAMAAAWLHDAVAERTTDSYPHWLGEASCPRSVAVEQSSVRSWSWRHLPWPGDSRPAAQPESGKKKPAVPPNVVKESMVGPLVSEAARSASPVSYASKRAAPR